VAVAVAGVDIFGQVPLVAVLRAVPVAVGALVSSSLYLSMVAAELHP
jgi:hypothetical protein